jgi:dipeptidyl-peptidase-4
MSVVLSASSPRARYPLPVRLLPALLFLCFWPKFVLCADDALLRLATESLKLSPTFAISQSGRLVAWLNNDGNIDVTDTRAGAGKLVIPVKDAPLAISCSRDDRHLVVAGRLSVSIFKLPAGKLEGRFTAPAPFSSVEISPDSQTVSFVSRHNLWLGSLSGKALKQVTPSGSDNVFSGEPDPLYAAEFRVQQHYWWSPDSSSIAYIETAFSSNNHYPVPGAELPKFCLKVLNVKSGEIRTVTESNREWPYLLRVAWHPGSRRIVMYRMNRLQNQAQLCLADGAQLSVILTEKDGYWVNVPESPLFLRDGESVAVTSERSGQRHVFIYNLKGESMRDITPDGMEAYRLHPAIDARGRVFVTGRTIDQEQNLFRLDSQSGECTKLTSEAGWHNVRLDATGDGYVDLFSAAGKPPSLWRRSGEQAAVQLEQLAVSQAPVSNEVIRITTHDNVKLPARLFKPKDFEPRKKYAVILYTFSGPPGRVVEDAWDGWQMAWNRYMVDKGYLVLAVDTRGAGGYGHLFEESIHYRLGAQELADLREVVSFLRRQPFVDEQRLGIWGCDYGAHTVVHAMLEFPKGFKAGFADSPIADWRSYDAYFTERYLGLPLSRFTEYQDSSPLESVRRTTGQLFVADSPANPVIRKEQVETLQSAFKKAKYKNAPIASHLEVLHIPDNDYREDPHKLAQLLEAMTAFFDKQL